MESFPSDVDIVSTERQRSIFPPDTNSPLWLAQALRAESPSSFLTHPRLPWVGSGSLKHLVASSCSLPLAGPFPSGSDTGPCSSLLEPLKSEMAEQGVPSWGQRHAACSVTYSHLSVTSPCARVRRRSTDTWAPTQVLLPGWVWQRTATLPSGPHFHPQQRGWPLLLSSATRSDTRRGASQRAQGAQARSKHAVHVSYFYTITEDKSPVLSRAHKGFHSILLSSYHRPNSTFS